MQLNIKDIHSNLPTPSRGSEEAAGFDLSACGDYDLLVEQPLAIRTGYVWEIPRGWCGLVCSRSGLAARHGVFVLNAPGVIDSDYRGEVMVIMFNTGRRPFRIEHGDRIAQMLITPVPEIELVLTDVLGSTARGVGGLGSTGVS